MNWKSLSFAAILLAIIMALGFGYDQPLVGLGALVLLMAVGVMTLYRLSREEPPKRKKKR